MGHITEPKNIDFIIESPPLSDKERREISEYIEQLKKNENLENHHPNEKEKKADRTTKTKKT